MLERILDSWNWSISPDHSFFSPIASACSNMDEVFAFLVGYCQIIKIVGYRCHRGRILIYAIHKGQLWALSDNRIVWCAHWHFDPEMWIIYLSAIYIFIFLKHLNDFSNVWDTDVFDGQVYVKFSALFRVSRKPFPYEDTSHLLSQVISSYGANRVMWGRYLHLSS